VRILVIEDNTLAARGIELILRQAHLVTEITDSGEDGVEIAKFYEFDLIILDLSLPDVSGFEVLRALRAARVKTPVLVLSAADSQGDKLRAFRLGADDYLTKPFDGTELIARVYAIIRRNKGHAHTVISVGQLALNLSEKTVRMNGQPVELTRKEYQMLELLALRKEATVTKDMFLNHLYGGLDEPDAKIIDVFICKLRKKLSVSSGGETYIHTVWGRGYTLRTSHKAAA